MATKCRRKRESQTTRFFKIVVKPQDNRLRLPSAFMKRHGRYLSDHVSLKAPNGSVRQVRLLRSNGETWLHKGWQEFKQYYSLGFGQLLAFTYNGNSHFDVCIYGTDAMEIEYPNNNTKGDKGIELNRANARVPETVKNESESNDSIVFLKEISTNKKRKGGRKSAEIADHKDNDGFVEILKEDSSARQQRKKKRSNDNYMCNPNKLNEISDDCLAKKSSRRMPKLSSRAKESVRTKATIHNCRDKPVRACRVKPEERSDGSANQSEKRVPQAVRKETCTAYQKAKSCKFDNPFYICLMQPSYVCYTFRLSISFTFTREILPKKQNIIKLRNLNGKTWSVKCYDDTTSSKISVGWKGFVQDNALKVGDVCVFEVNKSNRLVWDVTIFRS